NSVRPLRCWDRVVLCSPTAGLDHLFLATRPCSCLKGRGNILKTEETPMSTIRIQGRRYAVLIAPALTITLLCAGRMPLCAQGLADKSDHFLLRRMAKGVSAEPIQVIVKLDQDAGASQIAELQAHGAVVF